MTYKEFLEYLEMNFDGYEVFMEKAAAYQQLKNQKRPAKSRWNDNKVEKATNEMWKKAMQPLYDKLRREIKSSLSYKWTEYIAQHEILESLRDAMADLSFDEAS